MSVHQLRAPAPSHLEQVAPPRVRLAVLDGRLDHAELTVSLALHPSHMSAVPEADRDALEQDLREAGRLLRSAHDRLGRHL